MFTKHSPSEILSLNFEKKTVYFRLRVVSNFGDGDCGAGKIHTHVRVYFARPTIAIAKIRDYSQSSLFKLQFSILMVRHYYTRKDTMTSFTQEL